MIRIACTATLALGVLLGGGLEGPTSWADEPIAEGQAALSPEEVGILRARLDALLAEARVLESQGKTKEALRVYRSVATVYEAVLRDLRGPQGYRPAPLAPASPRVTPPNPPPAVDAAGPAVAPSATLATGRVLERAAEHGLKWLAAHQSEDGSWDADGFGGWCDGKGVDGPTLGPGKAERDVGVTGLALSAFLAAGYTNRGQHAWKSTVSRGLRWLKRVQDAEGCFGPRTHRAFVYDHAAATAAMVKAYALTRSPIFKGSARRGLAFIHAMRSPGGVWRLGARRGGDDAGNDDTTVSGWMALSLLEAQAVNDAARQEGREPPLPSDEDAMDALVEWIHAMTDEDTGRTGHLTRGGPPGRPVGDGAIRFPPEHAETPTAIGVFVRHRLGYGVLGAPLGLLRDALPRWDEQNGAVDMEYWLFGTLAAHSAGGNLRRAWVHALGQAAAGSQRKDGDFCAERGSWDPAGVWGAEGGRVYATAVMTWVSVLASHGARRGRLFGIRRR